MGTDVIESVDALHASANRLYWHSEHSVDALAARLGMSRHALYGSIRPQPTGQPCPDCDGELAWANRSARNAGHAKCPACGAAAQVPHVSSAETSLPPGPVLKRRRTTAALRTWARAAAAAGRRRALMLGGAAVLGAAAGLATVGFFRELP